MAGMAKVPRSPPSKPLLRDDNGQLQSRPIRKRNRAQPQLLFDPMPDHVEPALAVLKAKAPAGNFGWEIKWDGYRLAVHIEPNGVRLLTRVLDEQGCSDFNLLQSSLGADGRKSGNLTSPAILYAFDILYLDGHDLRGLDYQERRHLLEDTLSGHERAIRLSEEIDADPCALLEHACRLGLEGIVGKNRDSKYRSGRTGDWVKLKCVSSEGFMIVGYEPSNGAFGGFASLLLGAYKGVDLVYVGSVGTGFKEAQAVQLRKMMEKLLWKQKLPPVPYSGNRQAIWLQPTLIAEIEYRAWTTDGKLRHPAYKGLREVQDNADVYRIEDGLGP
jgi:bifunctional non-homologous end joining protein LigD